MDNNFLHNVIYTTLLTVKYSKDAYARLKRENETTSSGIIRKRCRALMAKMTEPGLSDVAKGLLQSQDAAVTSLTA